MSKYRAKNGKVQFKSWLWWKTFPTNFKEPQAVEVFVKIMNDAIAKNVIAKPLLNNAAGRYKLGIDKW